MARNAEESVRWLRDQTQASSDQADEQEVSSCIGKNSEIVKPQRKRNTVCVISCLSISLILNVTLGIVVVCLVRNKQAKINNEPVHLELSYESRTGDDTICVPCRGPLSTDLTLTNSDFVSFHQSLCCGSGESLSSLVKLFTEQSKEKRGKDYIPDNLISDDYRRENFTIERSGLYIIYFHFNFRVPTNYSNSPFTVTISITDSLDNVLLSQKRRLQKPMPNGGYENVVLFESLKLRRGTYFMKLDVSDKHTLYSYIGSKGLTVYKV
uniref:Uncharacterized protein LOC111101493 n=1 Tax=Crassostrea virginica TaxID=6565 RepID=A0A8B8AEW9_CRAVI|nr:uncharacterized protein LOC111101493 [Crassostrea virginica]